MEVKAKYILKIKDVEIELTQKEIIELKNKLENIIIKDTKFIPITYPQPQDNDWYPWSGPWSQPTIIYNTDSYDNIQVTYSGE